MAAFGYMFNLIDAIHIRASILWNSYLEATEEEKELAWDRIADIFGLNKFHAQKIAEFFTLTYF